MTIIDRSALLPFSAEKVFDLVADIEGYPDFLPGCVEAEIIEQNTNVVTARLALSRVGITQSFMTQNTLTRAETIDLRLVDGPFERFAGVWTFKSLAPEACKVALLLDFRLKSSVVNVAAGKLFDRVAHDLVDAVVKRAHNLLGGSVP
ncbi:MAG: type II toxin-antitoxin system RatA family toxin [Luminiphilus sp.]|nr:type II toxin-antitoxin system RatA family toxin [Luminiphilus sp.]